VIYPSDYYAFSGVQNPLVAQLRRRWEGGKVRLYRKLVGDGDKRILDVGCADGRFLGLLRDFGAPGWEPVGIDIDPEAVERCREQGFEAHVARMEEFQAGTGSFDAVIMLQLIEHVDDPIRICERVFALLRPGGHFIVETPNLAGLHRMLRERGFEIVRTDALISTSAWTISLHNFFLDRGYPDWVVRFCSYQNPVLLSMFVVLDWLRARLGQPTSNQRVVARKPA